MRGGKSRAAHHLHHGLLRNQWPTLVPVVDKHNIRQGALRSRLGQLIHKILRLNELEEYSQVRKIGGQRIMDRIPTQ